MPHKTFFHPNEPSHLADSTAQTTRQPNPFAPLLPPELTPFAPRFTPELTPQRTPSTAIAISSAPIGAPDERGGEGVFNAATTGYQETFTHLRSRRLRGTVRAGCPVLISDRTPWWKLEEEECGRDVSLSDPDRFRSILTQCIQLEDEEIEELSRTARQFSRSHASNPATLEACGQLFAGPLE